MSSSKKAMAVLGVTLVIGATGAGAFASSSGSPSPSTAPPSAPTSPPEDLSADQGDAIPRVRLSYPSSGAAFDPNGEEGPAPGDVLGPDPSQSK